MKVLVWNMNKQARAWDYLLNEASTFDVALLQETVDPAGRIPQGWSSVWRAMPGEPGSRRTNWGTAVVAPSLELARYTPDDRSPWLQALGGSVTVAGCATDPVWFASVHAHASEVPRALLDSLPWGDVPVVTRNGSVWETDLIPHELHRLFTGRTFIWGGDLNSACSMDDNPNFAGGNRRLREIWHLSGSRDLRLRFFDSEQQTFFAPRRKAYQLDHVFADMTTEKRVTDWRVDTRPVMATPPRSDHAPIVIELR